MMDGIERSRGGSRRAWGLGIWIGLAMAMAVPAGVTAAAADEAITVAVADFDNDDTSGETADRTEAHAERVAGFNERLAAAIGRDGRFRVVPIDCGQETCTPKTLTPDGLIAAAREAGARLLVYGGVHKMSTLVQMGNMHALDLEAERLLVDRFFSFRGDSDEAFDHASDFLARLVVQAPVAP